MTKEDPEALSDYALVERAMCGNKAAVQLYYDLIQVCHVWDDLIDKDKPVADSDVDDAFWVAMIAIPSNPFYRQFQGDLLPLIQSSILTWWSANRLAKMDEPRAKEIANVMRYNLADIGIYMAGICGGREHARAVGHELRLIAQRDSLANFVKEMRGG